MTDAWRNGAGAWLLVAVVALTVAGELLPFYPDWITGAIGWLACVLFWPRLVPRQRRVVLALVAVGGAGIAAGMASGHSGYIHKALTQNVPLIGMLVAVSFLQLIASRPRSSTERLSTGKAALATTLIGVHLFGAVINFSAVAIFADRLTARRPLKLEQALGLSQAFIVGALWSPFYGAMAVALTVAPGANLTTLIALGIPLTAIGLVVTWFTLSSRRYGGARDFEGYPLHLEALWVPATLAVGVLVVHEAKPAWSVLAIIAFFAPAVTALTLALTRGGGTVSLMLTLIRTRVPEMGGEMGLFMAAGVLSAGMAGAIAALDLGLPFARFGGVEASVVLAAIVFAAWLGFHPVILVSVVGPWLAPLDPDPNLLAAAFLMSWGIGLQACPMANTVLALHARYRIPVKQLVARNRVFSAQMLVLGIAMLLAYAAVSGR